MTRNHQPANCTSSKKYPLRQVLSSNDVKKQKHTTSDSVLRLRLIVQDLVNEVESLDENALLLVQGSFLENRDHISFYEAVQRFEIALIRSALRQTKGHQVNAARLLNLPRSTLNAKIKQYQISSVS